MQPSRVETLGLTHADRNTPRGLSRQESLIVARQIEFRGQHAAFLLDETPEISLEGALSCGKTTVALWKELEFLKRYPGIRVLISRWTDDAVKTLLKPAFEQMARIHGSTWTWNRDENYYEMDNGSRCYAFGLKTVSLDPEQRYGKIRGFPGHRIMVDQAEQLLPDIASELRLRLRPDIEQQLSDLHFPRQLTFVANPCNDDHFLSKQFPVTNKYPNRKLYQLTLFDNRHVLPEGFIENALVEYPPEHPKHQTVILGQRGLNVIGDPVFENLFDSKLHVPALPIEPRSDSDLMESFSIGQHNPTWIIGHRTYHGGFAALAGVMGKHVVLEEFLPFVKERRREWFKDRTIKTCAAGRPSLIALLRAAKFDPSWRPDSDSPDVQLRMIEHVAGMLKRRTMGKEEAISINPDRSRWLVLMNDASVTPKTFLSYAFDGGYVWGKNSVSVAHTTVRQPHDDDEYSNAMRCVETLIHHYFVGKGTDAERDEHESVIQPSQPSAALSSPHAWMA